MTDGYVVNDHGPWLVVFEGSGCGTPDPNGHENGVFSSDPITTGPASLRVDDPPSRFPRRCEKLPPRLQKSGKKLATPLEAQSFTSLKWMEMVFHNPK